MVYIAAMLYGGVIKRTGTGEVPTTAGFVAALPHPETFMTVTFMFPVTLSTLLIKTCKKPITETAIVPVEAGVSAVAVLS